MDNPNEQNNVLFSIDLTEESSDAMPTVNVPTSVATTTTTTTVSYANLRVSQGNNLQNDLPSTSTGIYHRFVPQHIVQSLPLPNGVSYQYPEQVEPIDLSMPRQQNQETATPSSETPNIRKVRVKFTPKRAALPASALKSVAKPIFKAMLGSQSMKSLTQRRAPTLMCGTSSLRNQLIPTALVAPEQMPVEISSVAPAQGVMQPPLQLQADPSRSIIMQADATMMHSELPRGRRARPQPQVAPASAASLASSASSSSPLSPIQIRTTTRSELQRLVARSDSQPILVIPLQLPIPISSLILTLSLSLQGPTVETTNQPMTTMSGAAQTTQNQTTSQTISATSSQTSSQTATQSWSFTAPVTSSETQSSTDFTEASSSKQS